MAKKRESGFDKLGRLIKEESEDIREQLGHKMDEGFARIDKELIAMNRRLDTVIQIQLDEHANRLKKLETAVFSK